MMMMMMMMLMTTKKGGKKTCDDEKILKKNGAWRTNETHQNNFGGRSYYCTQTVPMFSGTSDFDLSCGITCAVVKGLLSMHRKLLAPESALTYGQGILVLTTLIPNVRTVCIY